jgi:hypothetical protein
MQHMAHLSSRQIFAIAEKNRARVYRTESIVDYRSSRDPLTRPAADVPEAFGC